MSDEAAETIKARAAVIICETGAVCNNGANPNCRSREVAAALFDAGLLCAPITVTDEMVERGIDAAIRANRPSVEYRNRDQREADEDTERPRYRALVRAALTAALEVGDKAHSDDLAVDRFATAMKAKLKWEREERGRGGWDDPKQCAVEYLAQLLIEHLSKRNPGTFEDVANFAMMLHQRGAEPSVLAEALTAALEKRDD